MSSFNLFERLIKYYYDIEDMYIDFVNVKFSQIEAIKHILFASIIGLIIYFILFHHSKSDENKGDVPNKGKDGNPTNNTNKPTINNNNNNKSKLKKNNEEDLMEIPIVTEGALPYFGHALILFTNPFNFIKTAFIKYGKIFKINLAGSSMIILCDKALSKQVLKSSENQYSFYTGFEDYYFRRGFSERTDFFQVFVSAVKKSIGVNLASHQLKMIDGAISTVQRLKNQIKEKESTKQENLSCKDKDKSIEIDLMKEMKRFVISTSCECFLGIQFSDQIYADFQSFCGLLNKLVIGGIFIPMWFMDICFGWRLKQLRRRIGRFLEPEIRKYIEDPSKVDSVVIRAVVDFKDTNGLRLASQEISNLFIALLFAASENTSLGATNTLLDLIYYSNNKHEHVNGTDGNINNSNNNGNGNGNCNVKYFKETVAECKEFIKTGDFSGLLSYQNLTAAVMESARLNTFVMPLVRVIKEETVYSLGGYNLKGERNISVCSPMIMLYGSDKSNQSNQVECYNPCRFIQQQGSENMDEHEHDTDKKKEKKKKESYGSFDVLSWSAGIHVCPGKMFAISEIKLATAFMMSNFKFRLTEQQRVAAMKPHYFSPSALVKRNAKVLIECI